MPNSTLEYSNFFSGDKNIRVVSRIVPASTLIVTGEIVNKGANAGEIAKIGATPVPTDAYGIALEDVTTGTGETASVPVLVEGSFNQDKVIYPSGKTITDYEIPLRNIGIILTNIINSEISR